jgi:ubiquinone/menaquinone biosynthesis C-methylase UbiE
LVFSDHRPLYTIEREEIMSEVRQFDPDRFKQQERAGFGFVAERYERVDADDYTHPTADALLEYARLTAGLTVLDVATGPGILARKIAPLVGEAGHVKGVDLSEDMVAVATRRAKEENLTNIAFEVMDAENMPLNANQFDRIVCSLGLMHFPTAEKAVAEIYRVLKPGGRFAAAVWGEEGQIPYIQLAISTMRAVFGPPKVASPAISRFGQAEVLTDLLATAGFKQVETKSIVWEAKMPSAETYWKRFLDGAGIVTIIVEKQPAEIQEKLRAACATEIEAYKQGDGYNLDSQLRLVTGIK